jgi:uracil-DNA glycosylase family 4
MPATQAPLPPGALTGPEAPRDCPLCPRLVAYREANRAAKPDWWNGAVPSWGDPEARLLVAGLAPGRSGANATGRPFTGDAAGVILYDTLARTGFASGTYRARPDDDVRLHDCMITNAVRCAPPANKPESTEEANCRPYLAKRIAALPRLRVIVTLGDVSRRNVLRALGARVAGMASGHGVEQQVGPYTLLNSYHCSRLNTNTGKLTPEMFEAVFRRARALLDG